MCVNVWVHVCGWVMFSIPESGIPSSDKRRGVLVRSDKPWGEGGGADVPARARTRLHTLVLQCGCTLPTSSGMRCRVGVAQRHELEAGPGEVQKAPYTPRQVCPP